MNTLHFDASQQILMLGRDENPFVLDVNIDPKNQVHKMLMSWNIAKRTRKLKVYTLNMSTVKVISKMFLSVGRDAFSSTKALADSLEAVRNHKDLACKIIATAVRNKRGKYSRACMRLISDQFTGPDIAQTLLVVIEQMQLPIFVQTVSMIRGIEIISSSPEKQNENG